MAENNKNFSPLDSLGPEYGKINPPKLDPISMQPFEGDRQMRMPEINFPEINRPLIPSLNKQDQNIQRNIVGTPPNKPGINPNLKGKSKSDLIGDYFDSIVQANQSKDSYSKLHAYNAGSSGNAFYKRYLAYGADKFTKIGFNPVVNNEANFNTQTTVYDDWKRMMTHSFIPLFTRGFVSGPKSLAKMLQGDFRSADLEDARAYEEAAAIGQSSKGGVLGFLNNAQMNFAYTAGIITEAIAEEVAGAVLAVPTGGASLVATTANASRNILRGVKGLGNLVEGAKSVNQTLKTLNNVYDARKFWQATKTGLKSPLGRFINPLENTVDAFQSAKKLDNIGNLALLSKTAGGFYRDVRGLNMAVSEARLEAGMVENKVYDKLYNDYVLKHGKAPSNEEQYELTKQSKEASLETFNANAALIYGSNKITFGNIVGPRGGLRNFVKSSTDDILEIAAREGEKNFGKYGKVVYDKAAKAFTVEKNNIKGLAKSWYKNPGFKTAGKTIGYFKANFSEGIQENLQEVIARANEKYYLESYQSPYLKAQHYSKAAIKDTIINRKRNIFGGSTPYETYFDEMGQELSSQGLETFASGFVMGAFASPLNNSIPFLSAQWNRTFDKPAYEAWKNAKKDVAEKLVQNLNDISVKDFLSNKYYNAGSQDTLSLIKEAGSKKEGKDSELESYINQVDTMLSSNTSDLFIEQLESLRDMSDEEFADSIKLEGDEKENVDKYRSRLDNSINKLKGIQKAFTKVDELLPNPYPLPEEDDIDKDEKEFLHMSWKMAQRNFVYFNESYKDSLTRINGIQQNYLKTENLKTLSNAEVGYLFDPSRLGDALNAFKTEAVSLAGLDPAISKEKIKRLDKKYNTLKAYQDAYEAFDKVFNRTKYTGEIKAKLVAEKIEPTPEAILERMNQEYGTEEDDKSKDKAVAKLKKAHEDYLNAIALDTDGILFKEELDQSFKDIVELYKLKQESKDVAKFANFIADPKNFYDTVISNLTWMRTMYNSRNEYYTNLVNEQMNNAISNTLLNKLAEQELYMSADDFLELQNNGVLPSEFFDNKRKWAINKGTSRYQEIIEEYIAPYLEIINEKAEVKKTEKNLNDTRKTFKDKMEAEIANLPKEERVVDEQVLVKEDGTPYSILEAYEVMPNGYYMTVEASDGKSFNSTLKFIKEDDKLFQFGEDDKFLPTKEELSVEKIKSFDEFPITKITIFKMDMAPNPEDVEAVKKKYGDKLEEEQEDFDSTRPEAMQKSIDEILELANLYESIVKTKTNYFIDGTKHERMSNAIKSKVSLFTSLKRTKVEELVDSTIGELGFTKDGLKAFMKSLEDEYGDASGFDQEVYKAIREELESIVPEQQMSVGAVINPQLKARLNTLGYKDSLISNLSKEEQKRILDNDIEFKDYTPVSNKADIERLEALNLLDESSVNYFKSGIDKGIKEIEDAYVQRLLNLEYLSKPLVLKNISQEEYDNQVASIVKDYASKIKKVGKFRYAINLADARDSELADLKRKYDAELAALEETSEESTNLRAQGSAALKAKINSLNNEISNLVSIRDTAKNQSVIDKQIKALQNKKQELESELKQGQEKILSDQELKNYIVNTIDENAYENKRKGGTYLDTLTKSFLDGKDIPYDSAKISEEAFDALFGANGFITDIRRRIDSGELWVYAKDLIVASDTLIDDNNNMLEPVAGEIDFIFVDKEGNKFIVDLKSADARKWTQYKSDSGYGFNKRAENTLQQVGYANLIENTIGKKYGITVLPVALEYDGNKIAYASRPDIVLDIEKQPIGDPNEKPFNVTLDENLIIPINEDGTVVNLTAKEIMQKIIPVNPPKKTKGKAQPQAKTTTPAPTEQVTFTDEELAEIAEWQKLAETKGAEFAIKAFHSAIYPGVMSDNLLFFEKDGITPSKLYNAIINVINEVGLYESNLPVKVSELPKINSKYYALNSNFVEQYSEVVVLNLDTDKQTITIQNTNGNTNPQTMSLTEFMENFSSYKDVETPTEKSTYTPTENEKQNATENKTNVDEFLNNSEYINTVEEKADAIDLAEARKNLFDDLNCL
jgi:hypothetical protein